eukprot:3933975-Rhodomonas_salina.1
MDLQMSHTIEHMHSRRLLQQHSPLSDMNYRGGRRGGLTQDRKGGGRGGGGGERKLRESHTA